MAAAVPRLIVFSGLPGVGKTAVATETAQRLRAVHLSVDPIENALLEAGLDRGWATGVAAYEAARAAAELNLALGRRVLGSVRVRAAWTLVRRSSGCWGRR